MAGQQTINQHYVPKFYLKEFTAADGKLIVYNKLLSKFTPNRSPSSAASAKFYYSQQTGVEDELGQEMENYFQNVENWLAPKYRKLCEIIRTRQTLCADDHLALCTLTANFYLRGNLMRQKTKEAHGSFTKQYFAITSMHPNFPNHIREFMRKKDGIINEDSVRSVVEFVQSGNFDIEYDNIAHLQMIGEHTGFTNFLSHKKVRIWRKEIGISYITSDSPVIEMLSRSHKTHPIYGPGFMDYIHAIALAPDIMVEFHNPYDVSGKHIINRRASMDKVAHFNADMEHTALKESYGQNKEDFFKRK